MKAWLWQVGKGEEGVKGRLLGCWLEHVGEGMSHGVPHSRAGSAGCLAGKAAPTPEGRLLY